MSPTPDLFEDDGAASLAAMAEAIKEIRNSVSKLAEKVDEKDVKKKKDDDYPYPEPGKDKGKMEAEFEKQISELKEQSTKFEEANKLLKTELDTFHAKEHTEQIAGIVDAQFAKGLITEESKAASAEALKDFSTEQLVSFGKQIEIMNATPAKTKAFKQSEPGDAGATDKETEAAKLETTKKEFSSYGLKPETAELIQKMEAGAL